jgi:peptidyl-prolyl cis-trans isomerase SurA
MYDMKQITTGLILLLLLAPGRAQEPELVSEIVARVNNDIITRADYLTALRDFREELARQMQGKSEAEINAEFERLKPTVLDLLIEDLLLEQKAKELNIDVEAEVNQQMAEIAKENGYKNPLDFENALRQQGIDPDAARASLRKRLQHQYVIQREVLQPIFQSISEKERREFYEKNKESFTIPGEVVLSEIFLPLEGHTAAEVEQRARRLIQELRAGADFAEAVQKNSPVGRPSRAKNGLLGSFKPGDLKPDIAAAIANLKPGEVTEPIRLQDGFQIIRVDERKQPVLLKYGDERVQQEISRAITMQRAEEARKKYIAQLREQAFIEIKKGYESAAAKADKQPEAKQAKTKN